MAVLSMGGVVVSRSLRVAGDELDEDIIQYLRKKYNLLIGERMAEQIKISIGSAYPLQTELTAIARGRNLVTGLPGSIEISSIEIRDAMSNSIQIILDTIRDALDEVPPELVSDLLDNGVCLAGGGSQILGLVPRLRDELNLRVWIADDPMTCVARGTGIMLENLALYEKFIVDLDQIHN
jgi:rod shape-determining protein MreB